MVTCGRDTYGHALARGLVSALEAFGVEFINDTCWCMIGEPIIPPDVSTIMTNSAKFAHYGGGLSGRAMRFGSLGQCLDAATSGRFDTRFPSSVSYRAP
jgi:predicted aconitase